MSKRANGFDLPAGASHIAYFRTDGGSQILYTEEYVKEKDKEIDRLNNIINELERHLHQEILEWQDNNDNLIKAQVQEDKVILDKLKELKEDTK